MSKTPTDPLALTGPQTEALVELATRGSGGSFDQKAIGELFRMGLVDIRSGRLTLTQAGRETLAGLTHSRSQSDANTAGSTD